jgi:hypothetical protein
MAMPHLPGPATPGPDENSLTWSAGKSFVGFGVRFALRANSAHALERALAYLPLGWEETLDVEPDYRYSLYLAIPGTDSDVAENSLLYANSELLAQAPGSESVLQKFAEHSRILTTLHARERLFVHAGVVGWQGQAIIIPGRSLSGKTTLVKALVKAGAVYYSDEFALLDRDGYAYPYPLPLSLRAADGAVTRVPITRFGGQVGNGPLPVKLILITRYADGAVWRPQTVAPAQAMLALMENTDAARRAPQFSMPVLRAAALRALAIESARGEAEHIVPDVLNLVAGE